MSALPGMLLFVPQWAATRDRLRRTALVSGTKMRGLTSASSYDMYNYNVRAHACHIRNASGR